MTFPTKLVVGAALACGVGLGWLLAGSGGRSALASGGDRAGESIVTTGTVLAGFDESTRSTMELEAVYYLDYKGGRLIASIPIPRQTGTMSQMIDGFEERDLVADFKLDIDAGPRPRFLMTTGGLGPHTGGISPLYVFETTTSQLAVYRLGATTQLSTIGGMSSRPKFELVQLTSFAKGTVPTPLSK